MPRQLAAIAPNQVSWINFEARRPTGREVSVHPQFSAAKHGTEMAFLSGKVLSRGPWDGELGLFTGANDAALPYPFGLGNMTVGHVEAIGPDVTTLKIGDRVLIEEVPFRELHIVGEDRCYKIPAGMSWKSAVCLDPSVFALGGVRDGNVRMGDVVAVFGLGAVGLMAVQMARHSGAAKVIAVDPVAARLELAGKLGADVCIDPKAEDAGRAIKLASNKRGADVCIEFSGSMQGLQHALRGVAYGGTVSFGAFPGQYPAGLDLGAEAHLNRPNLVFSRACSYPDRDTPRWDLQRVKQTCLQMLIAGTLTGEGIVSPIIPFENIEKEYARIVGDPTSGLKLGVEHK